MNPVVHFEMPASDRKRASTFYSNVFGWNMEETGPEMGNYLLATTTEVDENRMPKTPGQINGGFFEKSQENQVPSIVIAVDDINEAMKAVTSAGGKVLGEGTENVTVDIPGVGVFCTILDSEGNQVGVLQPSRG